MPTICEKFAKIVYLNKIAYCYTIIDANKRISLPFSGQINNNINKFFYSEKETQNNSQSKIIKTNSNPLDSFFPFDPYLLNRSGIFIKKYYQDFNDITDEELLSEDNTDVDDEDDDENEDIDDVYENNDEKENGKNDASDDDLITNYKKNNHI